jgi:glycosyltransferase involved in cell wall biosynthesis
MGGNDNLLNRLEKLKNGQFIGNVNCDFNENPIVSVSVATYNHGLYIDQCLESIINQVTDFSFEIVIGEDGSTDDTREKCIAFANKYPSKIRLFLRDRNESCIYDDDGKLLRSLNGISTMLNCRGRFLALCEGDDYWIDEFKLQKQYDLACSNKLIFVGHFVSVFSQPLGKELYELRNDKLNISLEDTIFGPPVHTSSFFFKNILSDIKFDITLPSGDDFLAFELLKRGNGSIIPEKMSTYRLSNAGTWSTISQVEKDFKSLIIQLWIIKNSQIKLSIQLVKIGSLYSNTIQYNNRSKFSVLDFIIIGLGVILFKFLSFIKWLKK